MILFRLLNLSHMITVGATLWVHVSDVSEGIMVHDLTHTPRIHPPFEDVIRFKT